MAAAIVRNDTIALTDKIEPLRIPIVGAQRPSMVDNDRLGGLGTPILVEDFRAVLGGDRSHCRGSLVSGERNFE